MIHAQCLGLPIQALPYPENTYRTYPTCFKRPRQCAQFPSLLGSNTTGLEHATITENLTCGAQSEPEPSKFPRNQAMSRPHLWWLAPKYGCPASKQINMLSRIKPAEQLLASRQARKERQGQENPQSITTAFAQVLSSMRAHADQSRVSSPAS